MDRERIQRPVGFGSQRGAGEEERSGAENGLQPREPLPRVADAPRRLRGREERDRSQDDSGRAAGRLQIRRERMAERKKLPREQKRPEARRDGRARPRRDRANGSGAPRGGESANAAGAAAPGLRPGGYGLTGIVRISENVSRPVEPTARK